MSNDQLFFALATLFIACGAVARFAKRRLDAKIDRLGKQVDLLVDYMVDHEDRIRRLEARTSQGSTRRPGDG